MKRSLYLKILMHWVVTLVLTEALIFALFIFVIKDGHRSYLQESVGRSTLVARNYLEAALSGTPGRDAEPGAQLRKAVARLAADARAKVWISGADGTSLAASFTGIPKPPKVEAGGSSLCGSAVVHLGVGPDRLSYAVVPVELGAASGGSATLHILSEREPGKFPHGRFGAGLALIGALVALIAVPLTRHITKPLKRLEDSALCIAGGDLSSRADVQGRDEIGRLGAAFNSMAETVERMVRAGRELTANVSHEMRSPLTRIRVAGECLKGALARADRADAEELLEGMWEDIDEADRMIGRILEYSKLDLHEAVPASARVVPVELLNGLLKTMRPLFRSKEIKVSLQVNPELCVAGDEDWLRMALKNLLENAARYTPQGGEVLISAGVRGTVAHLEVTNTAAAIPEDELERIFAPFYRGEGASSGGTGLGLAITRKIVKMHGGDIGALNTPQGFRVWLRLPEFGSGAPRP
jgi:signal transduction histidine kinase